MAPAATSQIGIETELRPAAHTSALRRGQLNQSTGSCTNQTEAWETCMTINGTCGYKSAERAPFTSFTVTSGQPSAFQCSGIIARVAFPFIRRSPSKSDVNQSLDRKSV